MHLWPYPADVGRFDIGVKDWVGGVLVRKKLPQQRLESLLEAGSYRRSWGKGRIQGLKLLIRGQRIRHRIARLRADAKRHFQLTAQLATQGVQLILGQGLGLHLVYEAQVRGIAVKAVAGQNMVQHHQAAKVCQGFVAEKGG